MKSKQGDTTMRTQSNWCEVIFCDDTPGEENIYEWAEYINVSDLSDSLLVLSEDWDELLDNGFVIP
jgi:hypothetical protein